MNGWVEEDGGMNEREIMAEWKRIKEWMVEDLNKWMEEDEWMNRWI